MPIAWPGGAILSPSAYKQKKYCGLACWKLALRDKIDKESPHAKFLRIGEVPQIDTDDCLFCAEKIRFRHSHGYGHFTLYGKVYYTHRLAWELANGPIPKGKIIRHTCDNPPCCNPKHLLVGTHEDNVRDMFLRGRTDKKSKFEHKNARFTRQQAESIIYQRDVKHLSWAKIAAAYHVEGQTARRAYQWFKEEQQEKIQNATR